MNTESGTYKMGAAAELRKLMGRLSLNGSQALATVTEVGHDKASRWLSGDEQVPGEVMTMLRGLAAMHHGQAVSRG